MTPARRENLGVCEFTEILFLGRSDASSVIK